MSRPPSRWCAARWPPAAWCCWCCCRHRAAGVAPGGGAGAVGVADRRTVRRGAPVRTDAGARRRRHGPAGGVVQRHGREPVPADRPARGVRQPAAPLHFRRQPRTAHPADHGAHGRRPDLRPQRRPRPDAAAVHRADGQRAGPVRDAAQRPARDLPARRRRGRAVGRGGRPAHHREERAGQRGPPGRGRSASSCRWTCPEKR